MKHFQRPPHPEPLPDADDDRRASLRYRFKGAPFPARVGKKALQIRLKDLSVGGAAGMMDEPMAVGDYLTIELDATHKVEAMVMWVRRVMVGMSFVSQVSPIFVVRCHEKHGGRRGPDILWADLPAS